MQRYIFWRMLQALFALMATSLLVFVVARGTGDPTYVMLDSWASQEDRAALATRLGLDKPLATQYVIFLSDAVRGDLGKSTRYQVPALDLVSERLPASLQLAGLAIGISLLLAVPVGVYSATRKGGLVDFIGRQVALLGQAIPPFWLGLILLMIFAVWLHWLPSAGSQRLSSVILPAVTMGWFAVAGIMRLTRSAMLDVLDTEYIKFARSKGLANRTVVWKHAFRNAMLPVVTFTAMQLVVMLAGAVVTETVFAWPGVGRLLVDSVQAKDFPVVQTIVLLLAALYIVVNLAVDVLYAYLNPRIRYQRR